MALVSSRAVLLRAYDYSETSQVLRFMTGRVGLVGVMAKGARAASSRGTMSFPTFASGDLTVYMKETRDLQTMKEFTVDRPRRSIGRSVVRLAAASVLAETVLRHVGEADTDRIHVALEEALDAVADAPVSSAPERLVEHGWKLVTELGYAPVLAECVRCGAPFEEDEIGRFDLEGGGVACADCATSADLAGAPRIGPGARAQLTAVTGGGRTEVTHAQRHLRLLGDFVTYHVTGGRPLDSFAFLASVHAQAETE